MSKSTPKEILETLFNVQLQIESINDEYWTMDEISDLDYRITMLETQLYVVNGERDKLKEKLNKIVRH